MNYDKNFIKKLDSFADVSVLVIGDVMLDRYWWGSVERISPEAPVPVVLVNKTSIVPGGAANVAANVAGLGAKVYLVGIVGEDEEAKLLPKILSELNISGDYLVPIANRPTTVKMRVVAHNQHVVRIDQEVNTALSNEDEELVFKRISEILPKSDVVIVSDYAKGLISETLISRLITQKDGKYIIVDPKGKNYPKYKNVSVITPNRKEAEEASGFPDDSDFVTNAGKRLLEELNLEAVLITQGEHGMTLFERSESPLHLESKARQVYDVTGAGDTVVATLGVAVGAGIDLPRAAEIANTAAGYVVEEVGTTIINLEKLKSYFSGPSDFSDLPEDGSIESENLRVNV